MILKNVLFKIKKLIKGKKDFVGSENYWEERYKKGGTSGSGSYSNLAEFKAQVLNDFCEHEKIDSVIEFGCGDGNQLRYFNFKNYLGFDVSDTILANNKEMFRKDSSKSFLHVRDFVAQKANLVLSLDVIYHLVEDEVFENYMKNLFAASRKHVVIYSSNFNQTKLDFYAPHVKHRAFTEWIERNNLGFKHVKTVKNNFPFDGNGVSTSQADFYFYQMD